MKKLIYSPLILVMMLNLIAAQTKIQFSKVVGGLTKPILITHANDSRLFIVEQAGRIKILNNGIVEKDLFLNITDRVNSRSSEQGLLGLAFHPNFNENGFIYVNYIATGENRTIVSRFNLLPGNPNKIDSLSEKIIMVIAQPFSNHNGGNLLFGKDGYLYIGMGDGGSAGDPQGHGQNKRSLLAKMLRIDIDTSSSYKIPASNPFVGDTNYRPEIWSLGLRNPWRWSFDRLSYDMWIGDVGQDLWEEVDFQPANSLGGENYGWKCYEGNANYNTSGCGTKNLYTFPVHQFVSDVNIAGCSVTGGHVYRGSECSQLYGKYIYGDYCSGNIWTITRVNQDSFYNQLLHTMVRFQLSSFGEDMNGEIYVCAYGANGGAGLGEIYKIVDTSCNIIASSVINNPSCFGKSDGTIFVNDNSSNGCKYTYNWGHGIKTKNAINLAPGKYNVKISNDRCERNYEFELINKKEDTICLTPLFVKEICEGDSAIIIACDKFEANYLWYKNGILDSTLKGKRIFVKEEGTYQVKTIDMLGCESILSESAHITVHPLPAKPSFERRGDTLIASSGYPSYVWYKDGQLIAGSTANYYVIQSKGVYCVQVIDTNQCRSECSDSTLIIPTNLKDLKIENIKILPNPSTGEFVFYFEGFVFENSEIVLFGFDGRLIKSYIINSGSQKFLVDLSEFDSGHYYFNLQSISKGNILNSGKLVKL